MYGWYKGVYGRPHPPSRATIENITSKRVELYCHVPPSGRSIPVEITPFPVEYSISEEAGIEEASKCL